MQLCRPFTQQGKKQNPKSKKQNVKEQINKGDNGLLSPVCIFSCLFKNKDFLDKQKTVLFNGSCTVYFSFHNMYGTYGQTLIRLQRSVVSLKRCLFPNVLSVILSLPTYIGKLMHITLSIVPINILVYTRKYYWYAI